jgi:hypothetical protein
MFVISQTLQQAVDHGEEDAMMAMLFGHQDPNLKRYFVSLPPEGEDTGAVTIHLSEALKFETREAAAAQLQAMYDRYRVESTKGADPMDLEVLNKVLDGLWTVEEIGSTEGESTVALDGPQVQD